MFFLKRNDLSGSLVRFVVLGVVLLTSFFVGIAFVWPDPAGLMACQVAFLITVFCASVGHLAGEFPRGDQFVVIRLAGSIAARSGMLLFFLLITRGWDLSNPEFIYYILAFYLVGLATDALLASVRTWQWDASSGLRNASLGSTDIVANENHA